MNSETKRNFEQQLFSWKESLLQQSTQTIVLERNKSDTGLKDAADLAGEEQRRNFTLRIRDRERRLIMKIDKALDRIRKGTFGICEECGEEISEKRLRARPVATLCIHCKIEQEKQERD